MSAKDMTLYLIWDTESEESEEDVVLQQLFQAVDRDGDDQGAAASADVAKDRRHKKRRKSSSSESEDSINWSRIMN